MNMKNFFFNKVQNKTCCALLWGAKQFLYIPSIFFLDLTKFDKKVLHVLLITYAFKIFTVIGVKKSLILYGSKCYVIYAGI
jgi:hypothetical protein